jgi:VWFA-related protein
MNGTGVFTLSNRVLAGSLALLMFGALAGQDGKTQSQAGQSNAAQAAQRELAQQAIPDAPKPQTKLPNLGSIAPGQGTTSTSADTAPTGATPVTPPASPTLAPVTASAPAASGPQPAEDQAPAYQPPPGEGVKAMTLMVQVNYVDLPFTVKDSKGQLVPGLQQRDVQVFENGLRQHISFFTTDSFPLSVALVVDQSMTYDNMLRVNDSLGALQGAFTRFDEVEVFTYNNGPKLVTDFTGAQSARLTQAIEISKGSGREPLLAGALSGPLSQTTVINNQNFDPNTASQRGHSGIQLNPPKELHTLNDAILAAAVTLSKKPIERRRVIYVISDGKEYGSTAKFKDVLKYLETNRIEVDGTLVGDSSLPLVGYLDHFHLPLTMRDNILPAYATATGGNFDAEFRTGGIEKSFAKIAEEVRSRYTLGYYSHEPFIDGKYRTLEVRVIGHGPDLTILTKKGYYPSAMEARPRPAAAH